MVTKVVTALLATAMFAPAAWAQDARIAEVAMVEQAQVDRPEPPHGEEGRQARRDAQRQAEARPAVEPHTPREADQPRPAARAEAQAPADWQGRDRGQRGAEQAPTARFDAPAASQPQVRGPQVRGDAAARFGGGRDAGLAARAGQDEAEARRRDRPQGWDRGPGDPRWDRDRNAAGAADDGRRPDARPAPFATDRRYGDDNRRFADQRRAEDDRNWNDRNRNDGRRAAPPTAWNRGNDWNRRWHSDSRFDWGRYRQQNRDLFRLPRYYAPRAWHYGYRRFSVGVILSSVLWGQGYWIDDPWFYRLPPAYGPYRWVRYYNDALLVDIRTGYVVDTVYDIFW